MPKKIAIVQSNYIPWRGYFDMIRQCDEFVLYDNVQYTVRDWRNRNRIKTPSGLTWLTIPVENSHFQTSGQRIDETRTVDGRWARKHLATLQHAYGKAPYFRSVMDWLRPLYQELEDEPMLSRINERLLRALARELGILTRFTRSTDYLCHEPMLALEKTERLLALCQAATATHYLSGPAARDYLDEAVMNAGGVTVEWMDYSRYPDYPQLSPPFEPGVSILDLLFCVGGEARAFVGRPA
ncbi:hypothetical protein FHS55_001383 [Angulomicrobium tetraedrale]|uniref:WbqC family protein n=1 Tax=Ancylobacter tetraedralis TaxID=217068 RepID=A0A839Z8P8_9HYPH|nr:WbqC family protein [Ancylobacter tetraedralis]MBB3770788.1 hypothetical protein [Ancylobacter tetraedralis]